jgi:signal transduction histidine kinase
MPQVTSEFAELVEELHQLTDRDTLRAGQEAETLITRARAAGDEAAEAWGILHRGRVRYAFGQLSDALDDLLRAEATFDRLGDRVGLSWAKRQLATLHMTLGDRELAVAEIEASLDLVDETEDRRGHAHALNHLAVVLAESGSLDQAFALYDQAEALYAEIGDEVWLGHVRLNRATDRFAVYRRTADEAERNRLLERIHADIDSARALAEGLGPQGGVLIAYVEATTAEALEVAGNLTGAVERLSLARTLARRSGQLRLAAELSIDLGRVAAELGRFAEARAEFDRALLDVVEPRELVRLHDARAAFYRTTGELEQALEAVTSARRLEQELSREEVEARIRLAGTRSELEAEHLKAELAGLRVTELEREAEERSRIVAAISHELRTPLTGVVGFANLLLEGDITPEESRELIMAVGAQARSMAGIVEDLLTVVRVERGTITLERKPVRLGEVLAELLRWSFDDNGTVRSVGLEGNGTALADAARVVQIVRNLLSNAFRYGGPGVRVVIAETGDRVAVEVRDGGPAIPEADRESIFEDYARSAGAVSGSTGLGLSIARELARRMAGDLAYHHDGIESVFTLTLPRA